MATYRDVKDIPNHPDKYLIDVRSKDEIAGTGELPASINIPLPQLEETLRLSEADFKSKYGRDKPTKESELIFSCKAGGRAAKAANSAKQHGYPNSKAYSGSWTEWARKECLVP